MSTAREAAFPSSLLLAGAGKMGGAMLDGWLALGLRPDQVAVVDPHLSDDARARWTAQGVRCSADATTAPPSVMVLAVKPQVLAEAAASLTRFVGPDTLLVSIVAGKTIADLGRAFPTAQAIARAMPNTPAAIGKGMTGIVANPQVSAAGKAQVDQLMRAVGQVEWLESEALIGAVTAVSGSGPAYVFLLAECLAQAAEDAGLDAAAAARLARATVEGAAMLMVENPATSPETLRRNVTSPGGTTAAALEVLMAEPGLRGLMTDAVRAAHRRAQDLSG
ncbi:MAG: pyrroline-5-carboxylate reductase [Methylobacterium mesophilicum]|nr:pyrroline-5-carboxylate reductase [Methylobacterium mesophilicum]